MNRLNMVVASIGAISAYALAVLQYTSGTGDWLGWLTAGIWATVVVLKE